MTRVKVIDHIVTYDKRHDVLHVFFYPEHFSIDEEKFPGVIIRRSIEDERITGLTILDYSKRDKKVLDLLLPEYDFSGIHYH